MNKNDLFQTFLISDFYDAAKNMYYSEFISYCKEVLDKLEDLDISPKGYSLSCITTAYSNKGKMLNTLYGMQQKQ